MSAAVFDHLLIGAGTVFDARRRPMATRLTLHPLRGDHAPEASALVSTLEECWPEDAGPLWLNLTHEATLQALVRLTLPKHIFVEVPAFLAGDPAWASLWTQDAAARARRVLKLAYRLMRFINSPAFGLSVEISSFQHALMVLGTKRLKRWLALLVTGAVDDPELKPLMFLSIRRGLLMEELVRQQDDESLRNEVFICGVFSLLDRMLGQPFERLLESLPVPGRVAEALAQASGPLWPWLELATAVEMESPYDIQAAAEGLMLAPSTVNRAVLSSLHAAWQMRDE
ncbi:MAG: hypothetical protein C4K60_08115 [Ideonella sp. MAG2]|nr:MAG: hypothetical protein C4K60_08115 [Ideonella sp. MAG2]